MAHKQDTQLSFGKVDFVIFDLDGLLLDTEGIYFKINTEIAKECGKVYSDDCRLKVLGTIERDTAAIIIRELELNIDVEEFLKRLHEKQSLLLPEASLKPGAERLLQHLTATGVPMAVGTSSAARSVELKLSKHQEIFKNMRHIVCGSSDPAIKNGKPAPDIFLEVANRFQEKPKPSQCLVFEDAPNGVEAARAAGMQVVMVPEESTPEEKRQGATLVLDSLIQFRPELFGLPPFPQ